MDEKYEFACIFSKVLFMACSLILSPHIAYLLQECVGLKPCCNYESEMFNIFHVFIGNYFNNII